MSLYSLLMVDDEEEVIQIIRRKIDWEGLGFQVCGQARNGIEALEMVEELQPDVVMTDIKMPYMDGLEFAKQLKNKYRDIRVIILSGFDEFDYVKQAIGLEVEQYLLKPIDSQEIRNVFEKLKDSIDKERDLRSNIAYLEQYYQRSLPILQEGFFTSLIENAIPEGKFHDYMEEYDVEFSYPFYAITIIHTSLQNMNPGMTGKLLPLSVRQLVEDSIIAEESDYIFNYRNNLVAFTHFKEAEDIVRFTDDCDRFCKTAKRTCQALVSIGIGKVVSSVQNISISYDGAREALSYRTLYGAGNAIYIQDIDPKGQQFCFQEKEHLHNVFKQLKMGTEESLKESIEGYMESLSSANLNLQGLRISMMDLVSEYYRFLSNNEIEYSFVSEDEEDIYTKLLQMDSLEEIEQWMSRVFHKLRLSVREQRTNKNEGFVNNAKDYVKEHFSNPELNIDMVCSHLGLSSSYFSTIFKKETGKTFVNYLTEYRMSEAERLLVEEDEKKYIIAEKVGYIDPSYFSYVFKKWFGVSPMKYKKLRMKE